MTRRPTCPICSETVKRRGEHFPFCSARCKTIDLGSWLGGDYRLPAPPPEDIDPETLEKLLQGGPEA